jgi:hypothetical protein
MCACDDSLQAARAVQKSAGGGMSTLLAIALLAAPAAERAEEIARSLPHVQAAVQGVAAQAAAIADERVREAVQAQLRAPGLPANAWAVAHAAEAEAALRAANLLDGPLPELTGAGSFDAAPGGPCPDGHHAYPGGLPVHTLANALHALALADVYQTVYSVRLRRDSLRAAALWHDSAKPLTLRWRDGGDCGREPMIAGTPAHHALGIAAAIARGLPGELVVVIAAAHAPPTSENRDRLCGWLRAGSILATGKPDAVECPQPDGAPIEAFVNNASDTDYALTGLASQRAVGHGGGWERFDKLRARSELQLLPAR